MALLARSAFDGRSSSRAPRYGPAVVRIIAAFRRAQPGVLPEVDPVAIAEAVKVLRAGGLVAFPTETVYGLGARGLHADEVAKIFAAKGRPAGHPVILHVDGEAMARSLSSAWTPAMSRLATELWP